MSYPTPKKVSTPIHWRRVRQYASPWARRLAKRTVLSFCLFLVALSLLFVPALKWPPLGQNFLDLVFFLHKPINLYDIDRHELGDYIAYDEQIPHKYSKYTVVTIETILGDPKSTRELFLVKPSAWSAFKTALERHRARHDVYWCYVIGPTDPISTSVDKGLVFSFLVEDLDVERFFYACFMDGWSFDAAFKQMTSEKYRAEMDKYKATAAIQPVWWTVLGGILLSGLAVPYFAWSTLKQLRIDTRDFDIGDTGSSLILGSDTYAPWLFDGQEMGVTIGSTGSGKFVAAIAPNMLGYPGSCFVIDPKGEVCAVTANARAQTFGQSVYRLDPFDTTDFQGGIPFPRATYNPLDALDPSQESFVSDAGSLATALVLPATGSTDPFWKNSAKELITAVIIFVATHPDAEGQRHLGKVLEYVSGSPETWEWLLRQMQHSVFAAVQNCGNSFLALADKTRSGVVQQARTELAFAVFPEIANTIKSSSFSLSDLFTGRTSVFIVLPADRLESHKQWLRLMVAASLMTAAKFKRSNVPVPVLWVIDEAARLGTMEEIPKAYSLMRGYGVRVWSFWQDLGQLKACYPDHWSSLVGNSFLQVLSVGDFDTAEYFAKVAGTHEVQKVSYSSSSSTGGASATGLSRSSSRTYSTQREARIQPEALLQMSRDRCYLRYPGHAPFFCWKIPYYNHARFAERAMPNPYYR